MQVPLVYNIQKLQCSQYKQATKLFSFENSRNWIYKSTYFTAKTMKCPIKNFFSKCGQIRSFLRIWSHLLKKSLMGNFIFVQCFHFRQHLRGWEYYDWARDGWPYYCAQWELLFLRLGQHNSFGDSNP